MPSLGSFDAVDREVAGSEEPVTFTLRGETFALESELSAITFLRFSRVAGEVDLSDPDAVGTVNMMAMFGVLQDAIADDDWPRFLNLVENGKPKITLREVMSLVDAIMENSNGFPTDRPSGSDGKRSTSGHSLRQSASGSISTSEPEQESGMRPVKPGDERLFTG